jgi:TP53 regulating kinase-like protein
MKLISEGAEAKIYATTLLGTDAIVKRRFPKQYRVEQLDTELRRQRTKTEARVLALASASGVRAPVLLLVDDFDIYMSRVRGANLSKMLEHGIPSKTLKKILIGAGANLGRMHAAGIAHGDYTPANIMVCGGKVCVIDFGLAAITVSVEEHALDILLMKRSLSSAAFSSFIAGYRQAYADSKKTESRLNSIERRGRYQTRTMAAV